ncbi:MAG: hypothetical protein LBL04_11400 [Bacteroidales bacterium]|jgi:hypothetical protein|nr:hypothetical protein [Bacteroidales bacterium]
MKVTVQERQSWFDLAIIYCGDALLAFEIARENGASVTDEIPAGAMKVIPDDLTGNRQIVTYYSSKGLSPATAVTVEIDLDRVFAAPFPFTLG